MDITDNQIKHKKDQINTLNEIHQMWSFTQEILGTPFFHKLKGDFVCFSYKNVYFESIHILLS